MSEVKMSEVIMSEVKMSEVIMSEVNMSEVIMSESTRKIRLRAVDWYASALSHTALLPKSLI